MAFLFGKRTIITLNKELLKLKFKYVIDILKTGIPAFFLQIANSILNIILNSTLSKYGGDTALSAIGIVTSVQTLILMPITGITHGQQPLISYNYGARQLHRVKETIKYASLGATVISIVGFLAIQFFTKNIVFMFNSEKDVVSLSTQALRIWFMLLPLNGCQIICANYFQAIGKIKISSILNLLRQIIILIPFILILAHLFGLYGIFYAAVIADGMAFIITIILFLKSIKQDINDIC